MSSKAKGTVAALIESATETAKQAEDVGNWTSIDMLAARRELKLTTVVSGKPLGWINMNAEHIDELVRLLQMFRGDLK